MPPDAAYLATLGRLFGNVTSLESGQYPVEREEATTIAGLETVRQIQGTVFSLPFSDESIDLVVVNGNSSGQRGGHVQLDWRRRHEMILGNLHRILAKNGCICLYASNRWDFRRISSHPLSPTRYVTVLRNAGFSDVRAYVAFPDCRMPRFVVPFDQGAYRYFRRHFTYPQGRGFRGILGRLIARSGIDRFLESHLLITGVKRRGALQ